MENLKLLITDNSLILSAKGKQILDKTFSSDQECFSIIAEAVKPYKKSEIQCFLSGSRLVTKTSIIRHEEKEPFVADKAMLQRLVGNALDAFLSEHKDKQLEIISSTVLSILINGYQVKELKKEKTMSIHVTVFFAAVPVAFKNKLPPSLHLASFAESLAHRAYEHSNNEEFIVCSAYERSTDVSVRKSGNFFETFTIPIGTHHALDHVMKGLGLNEEEAESHLILYQDKHIDPVLAAKVEASVLSFQIALDTEMKKALTVLADGISLPSSIYMLVAPLYKTAYEAAFRSDSYHSHVFSEKGFEVTDMSSILTA